MRQELLGRPLVVVCCAFALGLTLRLHPFHLLLWPIVLLLPNRKLWVLSAATVILGWYLAPKEAKPRFERSFAQVAGRVIAVPYKQGDTLVAPAETDKGQLRLLTSAHTDLGFGYRFRATGMLHSSGALYIETLSITSRGNLLDQSIQTVRSRFSKFLESSFPSKVSPLVDGMCFHTTKLNSSQYGELRGSGLIYIVSISGLQILAICLLFERGLGNWLGRSWIGLGLLGILLFLYVAASGGHIAAIRAACVALLVRLAPATRRQFDLLTALSLVGSLTLAFEPEQIYSAGFQLSYAFGIAAVLFYNPNIKYRFYRPLRAILVVGLPLQAYWFGKVNVLGWAASLLVLPVTLPLVTLTLFGFLLYFIVPAASVWISQSLVSPLVGWIMFVVDSLGGIMERTALSVPPFNGYLLGVFYIGLFLLWKPVRRAAPLGRLRSAGNWGGRDGGSQVDDFATDSFS